MTVQYILNVYTRKPGCSKSFIVIVVENKANMVAFYQREHKVKGMCMKLNQA